MNHDEYERQMIDMVNHNAKEKKTGLYENTAKKKVFTAADFRALRIGIRRTLLALVTAIVFALSIYDFIAVTTVSGYWAVLLFVCAIMLLGLSFLLLYAQGILSKTQQESKGEIK